MKKREEMMAQLRSAEAELLAATPARAAKLTAKIVRLKATVFDEEKS